MALTANSNFEDTEMLKMVWAPVLKHNADMVSLGMLNASKYYVRETAEGLVVVNLEGTKPQAHNKQSLLAGRLHHDRCCDLASKQLTNRVHTRSITAQERSCR